MTTKIVLSDGVTELDGIKSCTFKEIVNTHTNMRPGCVASASIEVEAYGDQTDAVTAGEELTYYQVDSNGNDTLIGAFYAEPTIQTRNTHRFIAYDVVSKLDVDFSARLDALQSSFPMTLAALVGEACTVAGVTLSGTFPMSSTSIQAFYSDGITCRQILSWAAEIACRFIRARSDGTIEFAWYSTATAYRVYPSDGSGNNETYIYYKQNGLHYENYTTATLDRVVIHASDDDAAEYIYPQDVSSGNTLDITSNLLLTGMTSATYVSVAQNIYTVMTATGTYRPAQISLFPFNNPFRAGQIVKVTDVQGVSFVTPVMSMTVSSEAAQLNSSGDEEYSASTNAVSKEVAALADNILRLKKLKVGWAEITTAVINTLQANGINANWINAGLLLADYLKLYGSMAIFSSASASASAGQFGYTSTKDDTNTTVYGLGLLMDGVNHGLSHSFGAAFIGGDYSIIGVHDPTAPWLDGGDLSFAAANLNHYIKFFNNGLSAGLALGGDITMNGRDVLTEIGSLSSLSTTAKNSLVAAINEVHDLSGTAVLWTNSDPTTSFAAQTLTISGLGDYNYFTVVCGRDTTNSGVRNTTDCYVPNTTETMYDLSHGAVGNNYEAVIRQRNVYFTRSSNTVRFSAGWVTGGSADDNTQMIPLYILGKKI